MEEKASVLVSSHILRELEEIVDSVVVIKTRTLFKGGLEDLRRLASDLRILVVRTRRPAEAAKALEARGARVLTLLARSVRVDIGRMDPRDASRALEEAGVEYEDLELERPSLEEAYIALVRGWRR